MLLALAGAGLNACGQAAPAARPWTQAQDVRVGATVADHGSTHYRFERLGLDSADGQRRYRLQLAIPNAAPPAAGHPLLLMLDGNAAFGLLSQEMLAQQAVGGRPLVFAALGYETERAIDATARAFDYTPPVPGEDPTWDDAARTRRGGGADLFLDLVAQQILPALQRRAPIDAAQGTLWGHSYGGLLVLYTLLTRPGLFARYAAADPSLWWHDGFILQVERQARPLPAGRPTALLLMTGGGTPPRGDERATQARRRAVVQDAAPALAQRQGARAGLDVQWQPFPGVGHGAMRAASIAPTLAFAAR